MGGWLVENSAKKVPSQVNHRGDWLSLETKHKKPILLGQRNRLDCYSIDRKPQVRRKQLTRDGKKDWRMEMRIPEKSWNKLLFKWVTALPFHSAMFYTDHFKLNHCEDFCFSPRQLQSPRLTSGVFLNCSPPFQRGSVSEQIYSSPLWLVWLTSLFSGCCLYLPSAEITHPAFLWVPRIRTMVLTFVQQTLYELSIRTPGSTKKEMVTCREGTH